MATLRDTIINYRRPVVALAALLSLSVGALERPRADPLNCKPNLHAQNRKSFSIKVLRFAYTVNGVEHIESLANKRLAPGETEWWNSQRLAHAAVDSYISSTRIEFKDDNSGAGDGYGPAKWSDPQPHTEGYRCLNGRNYAHYIDTGE
jgi:hypothetical protein